MLWLLTLKIFQSLLSILERTKDYQTPEIQIDSHRHKRTSKLFNSIDGSITASPGRYVSFKAFSLDVKAFSLDEVMMKFYSYYINLLEFIFEESHVKWEIIGYSRAVVRQGWKCMTFEVLFNPLSSNGTFKYH